MESWSTYEAQCSDCAHGGQEGGGEGENEQRGMEMRGQEIKRETGGWVDLYIFLYMRFLPELRSFYHGYFGGTKGSDPSIPARTADRWEPFR